MDPFHERLIPLSLPLLPVVNFCYMIPDATNLIPFGRCNVTDLQEYLQIYFYINLLNRDVLNQVFLRDIILDFI